MTITPSSNRSNFGEHHCDLRTERRLRQINQEIATLEKSRKPAIYQGISRFIIAASLAVIVFGIVAPHLSIGAPSWLGLASLGFLLPGAMIYNHVQSRAHTHASELSKYKLERQLHTRRNLKPLHSGQFPANVSWLRTEHLNEKSGMTRSSVTKCLAGTHELNRVIGAYGLDVDRAGKITAATSLVEPQHSQNVLRVWRGAQQYIAKLHRALLKGCRASPRSSLGFFAYHGLSQELQQSINAAMANGSEMQGFREETLSIWNDIKPADFSDCRPSYATAGDKLCTFALYLKDKRLLPPSRQVWSKLSEAVEQIKNDFTPSDPQVATALNSIFDKVNEVAARKNPPTPLLIKELVGSMMILIGYEALEGDADGLAEVLADLPNLEYFSKWVVSAMETYDDELNQEHLNKHRQKFLEKFAILSDAAPKTSLGLLGFMDERKLKQKVRSGQAIRLIMDRNGHQMLQGLERLEIAASADRYQSAIQALQGYWLEIKDAELSSKDVWDRLAEVMSEFKEDFGEECPVLSTFSAMAIEYGARDNPPSPLLIKELLGGALGLMTSLKLSEQDPDKAEYKSALLEWRLFCNVVAITMKRCITYCETIKGLLTDLQQDSEVDQIQLKEVGEDFHKLLNRSDLGEIILADYFFPELWRLKHRLLKLKPKPVSIKPEKSQPQPAAPTAEDSERVQDQSSRCSTFCTKLWGMLSHRAQLGSRPPSLNTRMVKIYAELKPIDDQMCRLRNIRVFACTIIPLLGIGIVTAVWGSLPYVTLGAELAFMGVMVPGYFMNRKVQRLSVEKDVLKMEHHLVNVEWKAEETKRKEIKPRKYYDSIDGIELPGHSERLLHLRKLSQELGLDGTLRTTSRLLVEGDEAKIHLMLPRHIRKQQFKSSDPS